MGKEHYNKKSDGGREVMGREEGGAGRGEEKRGEERRGIIGTGLGVDGGVVLLM